MGRDETWPDEKQRIAGYYGDLVERFGHDARACDYGSPATQRAKFAVLADVMDLTGLNVLDVGCGFADFADFLGERFPGVRYDGIDVAAPMVAEAHRLHPDLSIRRLDILAEDPGGPYDLVTANGIFYLLRQNAEETMRRLIERMFALGRSAVAFNSLSAWANAKEQGEFYADPLATLDFCRTLTPWVVLRHDYLAHDFTIFMYRKPENRAGAR